MESTHGWILICGYVCGVVTPYFYRKIKNLKKK